MASYRIRHWLFHCLRIFIGLILGLTALGKGLDLPGFAAVVGTYQVFPEFLWLPIATGMTLLEVLLAGVLLSGYAIRRAALGSSILHLSFTGWAVLALVRGLDIPNCGCFGVFLARPLTWTTVIEDSVLVSLSLSLYVIARWRDQRRFEADDQRTLQTSES